MNSSPIKQLSTIILTLLFSNSVIANAEQLKQEPDWLILIEQKASTVEGCLGVLVDTHWLLTWSDCYQKLHPPRLSASGQELTIKETLILPQQHSLLDFELSDRLILIKIDQQPDGSRPVKLSSPVTSGCKDFFQCYFLTFQNNRFYPQSEAVKLSDQNYNDSLLHFVSDKTTRPEGYATYGAALFNSRGELSALSFQTYSMTTLFEKEYTFLPVELYKEAILKTIKSK